MSAISGRETGVLHPSWRGKSYTPGDAIPPWNALCELAGLQPGKHKKEKQAEEEKDITQYRSRRDHPFEAAATR